MNIDKQPDLETFADLVRQAQVPAEEIHDGSRDTFSRDMPPSCDWKFHPGRIMEVEQPMIDLDGLTYVPGGVGPHTVVHDASKRYAFCGGPGKCAFCGVAKDPPVTAQDIHDAFAMLKEHPDPRFPPPERPAEPRLADMRGPGPEKSSQGLSEGESAVAFERATGSFIDSISQRQADLNARFRRRLEND